MKKLGLFLLALLSMVSQAVCQPVVTPPIFVPVVQIPGPSARLFASNPYYTCTNNRYVSTTGSGSNNGLTVGTPWDIPTAVSYAAPAGTCINLAAGSYSLTTNQLNVAHGGTSSSKTGYVVWRCTTMPFSFSGGVLQGEGTGCKLSQAATGGSYFMISVNTGVNYVIFEGFEITSNNNNNAGPCISIENQSPSAISHHIWLMNSDLYNCGISGLQWNFADWLFVVHNVLHDNAHSVSPNCLNGSGLTFYEPLGLAGYTPTAGNPDYWHSNTTGRTYNMVVAYNAIYHNYNDPTCGPTTDGDGIIMDNFSASQQMHGCADIVGTSGATCPYGGNVLIMGNAVWGNGGYGIGVFSMFGPPDSTAHIDIINNTSYSNSWDMTNTGSFGGALLMNQATNVTVWNNIGITVTGSRTCVNTGISCSAIDANGVSTDSWKTNLTYSGGQLNFANGATYPTVGVNHNLDGSNPNLTTLNPITTIAGTGAQNFALQAGSPAISFGQAFDLWQQSGTVDAGACPFSAPGPVVNCP